MNSIIQPILERSWDLLGAQLTKKNMAKFSPVQD